MSAGTAVPPWGIEIKIGCFFNDLVPLFGWPDSNPVDFTTFKEKTHAAFQFLLLLNAKRRIFVPLLQPNCIQDSDMESYDFIFNLPKKLDTRFHPVIFEINLSLVDKLEQSYFSTGFM